MTAQFAEVKDGSFVRQPNHFRDRITADGSSGYPVEPGRYRLIAARACPWANRAIIVRRLLGLEDAISMGVCGPTHDERSWTFDLDPGGRDPVLGIERIQDAYFARFPGVWTHGDFAEITESGGIVIHGRSDTVLNPGGVRIGTAEIYRQVEQVPEVLEAVCVGQDWQGDVRVVLFVRLREGAALDEAVYRQVVAAARQHHALD